MAKYRVGSVASDAETLAMKLFQYIFESSCDEGDICGDLDVVML